MSSTAIADSVEMVEALPTEIQQRVVDHLREYIADLRDEQAVGCVLCSNAVSVGGSSAQAKKNGQQEKRVRWIMSSYEI
ncbi:hypothetical protein [Planktothricoides raciborskii]|uniref:DUF2281 domain-containing protein n=1 Tax=Planktothricoides raciborskii GIHE-MW2 TaxID=2792601 RepID=A0AAU8JAZ1_9CYAN